MTAVQQVQLERVHAHEIEVGQRILYGDKLQMVEVSGLSNGEWCFRLQDETTGAKERVWIPTIRLIWRVI
jgi:hypothetical protein